MTLQQAAEANRGHRIERGDRRHDAQRSGVRGARVGEIAAHADGGHQREHRQMRSLGDEIAPAAPTAENRDEARRQPGAGVLDDRRPERIESAGGME